jgi:hypothetical protein
VCKHELYAYRLRCTSRAAPLPVSGCGIITDNTPKAIAELQECACKNGGNTMVFLGDAESGFHSGFGYSQQRVKARAIVLFVFPKETP